MRSTFTKKQAALALACTLALGVVSATANAQDINEKALVVNTRGGAIMSGTGLCWHGGFGPAPSWTEGCHPYAPVPLARHVAPEPAPAPEAMAEAAPPQVWEKVAFDANVLFDSDKSNLRAAGRDTLDQFVDKIHGLDSRSIMAVGYADRMGSESSNQVLSEERVDAVKAYLVSRGVAANRVQTSAWGETRPDTFPAECQDANNAKNVACMQPDRHVLIEISGIRIAQ